LSGFGGWIAATQIDAIDESEPRGKYRIFQELLAQHGFRPGATLVVGDHPESEIEAGNRLGMRTVQMLRPGVPPSATAHAQIHSRRELKVLP